MDGSSSTRRIRALKACTLCRQRKVKCDKDRPTCGACLKRGQPSLCNYEKQEWTVSTSNVSLKETVSTTSHPAELTSAPSLKVKQYKVNKSSKKVKPKDIDDECLDFYSNTFFSPVRNSQGTLTWVSTLKKDRFMNALALCLRHRTVLEKEYLKENERATREKRDSTHADFVRKWCDEYCEFRAVESKKLLSDGKNIVQDIEKYLINTKTIWLSVEQFFESELFVLFPYLDKKEYIDKLSGLIGPPNFLFTGPVRLTLFKSEDLATIGSLLVILRLITCSFYNFGKEITNIDSRTLYLMKTPTPQNVMLVIQKIQLETSSIRFPSLPVFQFLSMRGTFIAMTPEEYDCLVTGEAKTLGELLQYATHCSLHRDPDMRNTEVLIGPNKDLPRRLWHMVVLSDYLRFMNIGYPCMIDEDFYDTKLPSLDQETQTELEFFINQWFHRRMEFFKEVKIILRLVLNIRTKPTPREIKESLIPLIKIMKLSVPTIEDIMNAPSTQLIERCHNLRDIMLLLQSNSLVFSIYYHLFIFYGQNQDKTNSMHYLIELIKLSKMFYRPVLYLDPDIKQFNLYETFGSAIMVFPKIELCIHKLSQVFFTILSRIKGLKLMKKEQLSNEFIEVLDSIVIVINKAFSYIMKQYARSSDTYYHNWVLSKTQSAFVNTTLKVPLGPITTNTELTEDDLSFLKALEKTNDEDGKGDLGFEKFSLKDLKRIHTELLGLETIYNWNVHNPDKTEIDTDTDQEVFTGTSSPESSTNQQTKKKKSQNNKSEAMSENDKKWFDRMINELTHNDGHVFGCINPYSFSTSTTNNTPKTTMTPGPVMNTQSTSSVSTQRPSFSTTMTSNSNNSDNSGESGLSRSSITTDASSLNLMNPLITEKQQVMDKDRDKDNSSMLTSIETSGVTSLDSKMYTSSPPEEGSGGLEGGVGGEQGEQGDEEERAAYLNDLINGKTNLSDDIFLNLNMDSLFGGFDPLDHNMSYE